MIPITKIPSKYMLLGTALFFTLFLASCGGGGDDPVKPGDTDPEIVAFSPDSAYVGDEVQIQGLGFSPEQSENKVFFGGDTQAKIDSINLTEGNDSGTIIATVPEGADDGPIALTVNGGERVESGSEFHVREPVQQEPGAEFARVYWAGDLQDSGTGSAKGGVIGTSYTNEQGRLINEILYNTNNFPQPSYPAIYGFALDLNSEQVYWAVSGQGGESPVIARASLTSDIASVETLYNQSDGLASPVYVVLDLENQMLYWADAGMGIRKAPIDGSGPIETVYDADINAAIGMDMMLDTEGNMLYWTENGDREVVRAPKDGSGPVEALYQSDDANPSLSFVFDILVDSEGGSIYFGDGDGPDNSRILKGNLDGSSSLQTLYSGSENNVSAPSLALDQKRSYLYWSQTTSGTIWGGTIMRGKADGSGESELVYDLREIQKENGIFNVFGLAVSPGTGSGKAKTKDYIPPVYLDFN